MAPIFVGERAFGALIRYSTHLVKFPEADLCLLDDVWTAIGDNALAIVDIPDLADLDLDPWSAMLAHLVTKKVTVSSGFSRKATADELFKRLQSAGCQTGLSLMVDAAVAKRSTTKWSAWPLTLYRSGTTALPRQEELNAVYRSGVPTMGKAASAHWAFAAYLGLPLRVDHGPSTDSFKRLAQLLASSDNPDSWASGLWLSGATRLDQMRSAYRVEAALKRRIAIFDSGRIGPKLTMELLRNGDTVCEMLSHSAVDDGASALVINLPIPGAPLQLVIQIGNETYDLAQAVGATTVEGISRIVVEGELEALLSRMRQFFSGLN